MSDGRPRVLVPVTYGFTVRYLLPTGLLGLLADRIHPVVAVGWDDPELESVLRSAGHEVLRLPDARLGHDYRAHRRRLAVVHDRHLRTPTRVIRRRRQLAMMDSSRDRALSHLRVTRDRLATLVPGAERQLEAEELRRISDGTNVAEFTRLLRDHCIDGVVSFTPYHDQDALVLWAARAADLRSVTSVISFDNPTTRERLLVRSESIAVWNRYNAAELARSYADLDGGQIAVVGAPQFDLHRRSEWIMDRDTWRRELSIPADRPVLLYGAGPAHLVPGEPELVRLLDQAIDDGRIPDDPFLLVRRHPTDPPDRWLSSCADLRHGSVVDPWSAGASRFRGWPSDRDIALQMSSLAHSEVHINVCSSMTLDGAMFDRPQIGPMFVPGQGRRENARVAQMYLQEHWGPIAASGGLATASDSEELVRQVAAGLGEPDRDADGRRRMLDEVLTYTDGRSSARLVDLVADTLTR